MLKFSGKKFFVCAIFVFCFGLTNIFGQTSKVTSWINIAPNRFAPEFYADDLYVKAALVNLPGANVAGSSWMLSYEVYFLPEGHLKEVALKKGGRLGAETGASDFPKRVFLGKGDFTKKDLKTLPERTTTGEKFAFKSKVPAAQQTEGATLLTIYTLKIYDAKLRKTLVKSSLFFGRMFIGDKQKREKIYLNFYVEPSGEVYDSQLPKEDDSTDWRVG